MQLLFQETPNVQEQAENQVLQEEVTRLFGLGLRTGALVLRVQGLGL